MSKNRSIGKILCVVSSCAILSFTKSKVSAMKSVVSPFENPFKVESVELSNSTNNREMFFELYRIFNDKKEDISLEIYKNSLNVGRYGKLDDYKSLRDLITFLQETTETKKESKSTDCLRKILNNNKDKLGELIERYKNKASLSALREFSDYFENIYDNLL